MGTRGLYGFRKNGVDKTTYNHWDSYPDGLGKDVVEFCVNHTVDELEQIASRIVMINERIEPTKEQIKRCVDAGWYDEGVSTGSTNNWYCLLRHLQGNFNVLSESIKDGGNVYMIDNQNFITDSLFCEYAYIINLDTKMLEFWTGFCKKPQMNNRYGTLPDEGGYYPCKLSLEFPLSELVSVNSVVEQMNATEND